MQPSQPQPAQAGAPADLPEATVGENGELAIKHVEGEEPKTDEPKPEEPAGAPEPPTPPSDKPESSSDIAGAEAELEASLPKPEPTPSVDQSLDDLKAQLEEVAKTEQTPESSVQRSFMAEPPSSDAPAPESADASPAPEPPIKDEKSLNSWKGHRLEPPTMGGSLSSTSEEALSDKLQAEEDQRNHQLLSHDKSGGADQAALPADAQVPAPDTDQPPTISTIDTPPEHVPDLSGDIEDARKAVGSAIDSQEFNPAGNPRTDLGSQPMDTASPQPYIPLEPTAQPSSTEPNTGEPTKPAAPPTDANGLPIIPPMPALPTEDPGAQPNLPPMPPPLPPLPGDQPPSIPPPPTTDPNQPADPGQFKIPS